MLANLRVTFSALLRPVELIRNYRQADLVPDLIAGITVGVVLLPQGLAFALLAGLPPQMGLYAAVVGAIAGALWGSSHHLQSGPTNTASALTLSILLPIAMPGSPEFVAAAALIAILAGLFRLAMGIARLGVLVNFVSDSVVVGFTAGAGALIIASQLSTLLGVKAAATQDLYSLINNLIPQVGKLHLPTLALGVATILILLGLRRIPSRYPLSLIGIVLAAGSAFVLGLEQQGVQVIGAIPAQVPPFAPPAIELGLVGQLATGALALAAIGLVEATAIARALASNSGQRLDSNQEFVGQGMSNLVAGLFSGYPTSASFNRSALSYRAGAHTAMTSAFAGVFVLIASLLIGPLIAHLPRAVVAAELVLAAYAMIDRKRMLRIWRGARGDAVIMLVTFSATLLLPLQFAVLIGILMSLGYYIMQTSAPQVLTVVPDEQFRHWVNRAGLPNCPQMAVVDLLGDLYFGAVGHVEEEIRHLAAQHPQQRYLILRMHSVQRCDISGINMLEQVVRLYRARGGDIFFVRVRDQVLELMQSTKFTDLLGPQHIFSEEAIIGHTFHKVLDPAICIYECEVRVFRECKNLPKREYPTTIPLLQAPIPDPTYISALEIWQQRKLEHPALVVDVREPREFRQGHVPNAQLVPLATILAGNGNIPHQRLVVLVCRSGRRSARAAAMLASQGYDNILVMEGGMMSWEAHNLLQALDE
jgi:sulfate permease, SulP family